MAHEEGCVNLSFEASGDLTANYFEAVKLTSSGIAVCSSQGERAIGVLQNKPSVAGASATVAVSGKAKAYAGATIAVGDYVTPGADGRMEVVATGDFVLGQAVTAGADGEIITVMLMPSLGAASA